MLLISNELKNILEKFKNDPISMTLLNHKDLVDGSPNFLSVSNTDQFMISYVTPDRFKKIESDGDDIWESRKRFKSKPGSLMVKIFGNKFSQKDIEIFSNLYKTFSLSMNDSTKWEIVEGSDIKKWYHVKNYVSDTSSIYNSCMKHDNCQDFLDFYLDTPCKMLVLLNGNNKLIGRSLLWVSDCGRKIMDRVYTIDDNVYLGLFKKWAIDNGYYQKEFSSWNSTFKFLSPTGYPIIAKFSVKIKTKDFRYYPYLDSFKWLDNDGYLYNYKPDNFEGIVLINPYGGKNGANSLDMCSISKLYQMSDYLVTMSSGRLKGCKVSTDFLNYSNLLDKYFLKDECYYSEYLGDYIPYDKNLIDLSIIRGRISYWVRDTYSKFYRENISNVIDNILKENEGKNILVKTETEKETETEITY